MKVTIRFEAPVGEAKTPARELVCSVWPISRTGTEPVLEEPVVSSLPILVGAAEDTQEPALVELPCAGTYLVDLAHPSGRHTRRTIQVEAEQPYRFVVQDLRYAAEPVTRSVEQRERSVTKVIKAALKNLNVVQPDLEISIVHQPRTVALGGFTEFAGQVNAAGVIDSVAVAPLFYATDLPDESASDYRTDYQRVWLMVCGSGKHPTLVAYPREWAPRSGRKPFRVVARRKSVTGSESTKWSVSLELLDPTYGTLIEHLTRRDVQSTEVISNSMRAEATTALYEKQGNPFAAAAGAYMFALGALEHGERRQWMSNLSTRYPWLPDGSIALGWRLLREGRRGSPEWNEARLLFASACARGLPYYTVGLHILVEGLNVLSMSKTKDPELRSMLAAATAADIACVRSEPFTTLQVSRYLGLPQHGDAVA
jgi:hypothetical protein